MSEELTPHFSFQLPYRVTIQAIGTAAFPLGKGLDFCWVSRLALGRDAVSKGQLGVSSANPGDGDGRLA